MLAATSGARHMQCMAHSLVILGTTPLYPCAHVPPPPVPIFTVKCVKNRSGAPSTAVPRHFFRRCQRILRRVRDNCWVFGRQQPPDSSTSLLIYSAPHRPANPDPTRSSNICHHQNSRCLSYPSIVISSSIRLASHIPRAFGKMAGAYYRPSWNWRRVNAA